LVTCGDPFTVVNDVEGFVRQYNVINVHDSIPRFIRFRLGVGAVNQSAPSPYLPLRGLLHSDDTTVYGNTIAASVVVVTSTARPSAVQSKPLEQVGHASRRSSGGNVAGGGTSSLNGSATRLGCQRERVLGQNRLDVGNHASGQARGQGSVIAKREHDGLADLETVSSPRHNARISDADGNQRLGGTVSATLDAERIGAAAVFDSFAEFGLAGVKVQRDECVGHGSAVAGALGLHHPVRTDQFVLVDGLLGSQLSDVEQPLNLDPVDPLKILRGCF